MQTWKPVLGLVFTTALFVGCSDDVVDATPASSSSSSGGAGGVDSGGNASGGTSAEGGSDITGGTGGDSTTGTTTSSGGGGIGIGGGGPAIMCGQCVNTNCNQQVMDCANNPECVGGLQCVGTQCIVNGQPDLACIIQTCYDDPVAQQQAIAVATCVATNCGTDCLANLPQQP